MTRAAGIRPDETHWLTAWGVTPSIAASLPCPPTASHALSMADFTSMAEVKHRLPSEVKRYFLTSGHVALHNQGMLNSAKKRALLVKAMAEARPKLTQAALAEACGVSKQAVTGWRKTGNYDMAHIPVIASLTGKPIEYFFEESAGQRAEQPAAPYVVADPRLQEIIELWPAFSEEKRQVIHAAAVSPSKIAKPGSRFAIQEIGKGSKVVELNRKAKHRS